MDWLDATIESVHHIVSFYEDRRLQVAVLRKIPLREINDKTDRTICEYQGSDKMALREMVYLKFLLRWFKGDFFRWMDTPKCDKCGVNMNIFSIIDSHCYNLFTSVEEFACPKCHQVKIFPRLTDATVLLETRTGRCFEWSQVFCLICRGLKWRSRLVIDTSDHCWVEIFSNEQCRWIHVDPSEGIVDQPLLYENEWNKELRYIFAIGFDDVQDVTWRYTQDHELVRKRRPPEKEELIVQIIMKWRSKLLREIPENVRMLALNFVIGELFELLSVEKTKAIRDEWLIYLEETSPLKTDALHIWVPSEDELQAGQFTLRYSSKSDCYYRNGETFTHWYGWVGSRLNLTRILSTQRVAYLGREDGHAFGQLKWAFKIVNANYVIDKVKLSVNKVTEGAGSVEWRVENGSKSFCFTEPGLYEIPELEGTRDIVVTVDLNGSSSKPDDAFIFRQSSTDTSPIEILAVTFKAASNV